MAMKAPLSNTGCSEMVVSRSGLSCLMTEVLGLFYRGRVSGIFFAGKLCSVAGCYFHYGKCYFHYGKLGQKVRGICAREYLNVWKMQISVVILKQNKISLLFKVAEYNSVQFILSCCRRMWSLEITVSYCKFTIKLTRAVKPVCWPETWWNWALLSWGVAFPLLIIFCSSPRFNFHLNFMDCFCVTRRCTPGAFKSAPSQLVSTLFLCK